MWSLFFFLLSSVTSSLDNNEDSNNDKNNDNDKTIFQYGHFIVLERLQQTLQQQVRKWERQYCRDVGVAMTKTIRFAGKWCLNGDSNDDSGSRNKVKTSSTAAINYSTHKYSCERRKEVVNRLYRERIQVAVELSSGIAYLHEKSILHRDIKPNNIGLDTNGEYYL
jgi:hypothetical protein